MNFLHKFSLTGKSNCLLASLCVRRRFGYEIVFYLTFGGFHVYNIDDLGNTITFVHRGKNFKTDTFLHRAVLFCASVLPFCGEFWYLAGDYYYSLPGKALIVRF